jgi:hypothetical protein
MTKLSIITAKEQRILALVQDRIMPMIIMGRRGRPTARGTATRQGSFTILSAIIKERPKQWVLINHVAASLSRLAANYFFHYSDIFAASLKLMRLLLISDRLIILSL